MKYRYVMIQKKIKEGDWNAQKETIKKGVSIWKKEVEQQENLSFQQK